MGKHILFGMNLLLAFLVLAIQPAKAQALKGVVGYNVRQLGPKLKKAERMLAQADHQSARVYYESAKTQWDALHKDYKGKFDVKHPDIVAMQKQFDSIKAKLIMAGVIQSSAAPKLDSRMGYQLKQIQSSLKKCSRLLAQSDRRNALSVYGTAKQKFTSLCQDFKGKFDPDHPSLVETKKALLEIGERLKTAGLKVETPKSSGTDDKPGSTGAKAPPAAMVYVMKQIGGNLDEAMKYIKAKQLDGAQKYFGAAEKYWESQQEWNKGKYDRNHPDVVALETKYQRVKKSLEALEAEVGEATKNLPAVLAAITNCQNELRKAHDKARASFRNASSLMGDFDSGRENNVDKLRLKIDEVRMRAERINALLPQAVVATQAFRVQFPDLGKLAKLVRGGAMSSGRDAGQAVEGLEKFPGEWLESCKRLVDEALGYAKENIKQFGTDKLGALAGGNPILLKNAANNAEQWVLEYSAYLLEVIPSILPELSPEAKALLPEFGRTRLAFEKRAATMQADIDKVTQAVAKTRKDVANLARRRLEKARFPRTSHPLGGAEKDIKLAWAQAIKDKKLLKLSIYRPYEVRSEARWRNKNWVVNTYRYIGVNCLAKLASGKYMVYRMNFRNTIQPDGSWSVLQHWSVGHVFEIMAENIDK